MFRKWSDSVVVITGASKGIGRDMAALCAERGAIVHACARTIAPIEELAQAYPGKIFAHQADVTSYDDLVLMRRAIEAQHQHIDVLVLNAAVLGQRESLLKTDPATFAQTVNVNTTGAFYTIKAFGELLTAKPNGMLMLVSSSVGRKGRGMWGAYSTSKCGAEGLVDIAADEFEHTICVSINPGGTATDMRAAAYPDEDPATLPTSTEVAQTFVLLAERLDLQQNRGRYNSRDLFAFVDKPANSWSPEALPQA